MRKNFAEALDRYSELAKDRKKKGKEGGDENLEGAIRYHENKFAEQFGTTEKTQDNIFALQEIKQELMEEMKVELNRLDGRYAEGSERGVVYDAKDNSYYCADRSGGKEKISLGELLTDGEWGVRYFVEPGSVPRHVCKRYIVEDYKRKIRDRMNEQILLNELASRKVDGFKKKAYRFISGRDRKIRSGQTERLAQGEIAEKMVRNFLKKITYDYPDIEFDILEADAWHDVELKCDFFIRRKYRARGVKVEAADNAQNIGVQFTTLPDDSDNFLQREIMRKKKAKVQYAQEKLHTEQSDAESERQISDIVLISIPLENIKEVFHTWNRTKALGGPDKLWNAELKEKIFRGLLKDFFTLEEIENQLQKIKSNW